MDGERAGAPTGAGDEVNGPLRTEANCLDCGHLSRFAARRLCFFVRLRGRGCSIVNTPYTVHKGPLISPPLPVGNRLMIGRCSLGSAIRTVHRTVLISAPTTPRYLYSKLFASVRNAPLIALFRPSLGGNNSSLNIIFLGDILTSTLFVGGKHE